MFSVLFIEGDYQKALSFITPFTRPMHRCNHFLTLTHLRLVCSLVGLLIGQFQWQHDDSAGIHTVCKSWLNFLQHLNFVVLIFTMQLNDIECGPFSWRKINRYSEYSCCQTENPRHRPKRDEFFKPQFAQGQHNKRKIVAAYEIMTLRDFAPKNETYENKSILSAISIILAVLHSVISIRYLLFISIVYVLDWTICNLVRVVAVVL